MSDLTASGSLELLNGLAGLAALLNGLLLWPIVRTLKGTDEKHQARLDALEVAKEVPAAKPRRRRKRAPRAA